MTGRRRAGGLALALLLGATALRAQGLVSPGPLASAHARYDNLSGCLLCHDAGRELTGRKCLTCHASLEARIRADKGYHAVATKHGAELACRTCHSEHNGRPYRLVRWPNNAPRERFDHRSTGYTLEGAHARERCEACHRPELVGQAWVRADTSLSVRRTYLGLSVACATCHVDEHRGRVSRQCQDCHTQTAWTPAPRFDHDSTRFSLTGKHADVKCDQCHEVRRAIAVGPAGERDTSFVDFRAGRPGQPQRRGGNTCASCHNSPHRQAGRSGRCEPCHTTRSWFDLPDSVRTFDHTAIGYTLRGAHARAECEACHLTSRGAPLAQNAALERGNFLRPFAKQRMRFDRCDACHSGVHEGQFGPRAAALDCGACHTEVHFAPARFGPAAHDSTAYPLLGAHRATPCSRCHPALPRSQPGSGAVRFRLADRTCVACHRDEHGGQFAGRVVRGAQGVPSGIVTRQSTLCEACHRVDAWKPAAFEHDSTRYPLRGAHRRLACERCHTRPAGAPQGVPVTYAGLPTTCDGAGCHVDPHRGQFANRRRGGTCVTCHSEERWTSLLFDHQRDSDWPLDGAHVDVRCVECHRPEGQPPSVRYAPLPHACEDCHPPEPGRRRSQ
jgi:hypothetical protein